MGICGRRLWHKLGGVGRVHRVPVAQGEGGLMKARARNRIVLLVSLLVAGGALAALARSISERRRESGG